MAGRALLPGQKKRPAGDLPSPALPGSGPGGRRSASQLSGFSAFRRDSRVPPAVRPVQLPLSPRRHVHAARRQAGCPGPEVPAGRAERRWSVPLPLWRALHRYGYAEQAGAPPALAQAPERQPERNHDGQRAQRYPLEEHPGHAPAGLDRVCLAEQRVDRSRPQQGEDSDDGLGDDHLEPCAGLPAGWVVRCLVRRVTGQGGAGPGRERRAGGNPIVPGWSRCRRKAGPGSAMPWRGRGPPPPPARLPSMTSSTTMGSLHDRPPGAAPELELDPNLTQSDRLRRTWPPGSRRRHRSPEMPAAMTTAAACNHVWTSCPNSSAPQSCWPAFFVRADGITTGRLRRNVPGVLISTVDTRQELYDSTAAWREQAMTGILHSGTLVSDPRSGDRTQA